MSHDIRENDQLVWAGETPWHGLGKQVTDNLNVRAAAELANLLFHVERQQLQLPDGRPADYYATVRTDTKDVLGYVSPTYGVLQNEAALAIAEAMVGPDACMVNVAGTLGNGARAWLCLELKTKTGQPWGIAGDEYKPYLFSCWGHDGLTSHVTLFTPTRVVCNNTWQAALRGNSATKSQD